MKSKTKKKIIIAVAAAAVFIMSLASLILLRSLRDPAPVTMPETEPLKTEDIQKTKETEEMRGVYIATVQNVNFPTKPGLDAADVKAELLDILATTVDAGLNTICFQVRPCSDAFYDSAIFPSSKYFAAKEGDPLPLDVLETFVPLCHEKGVKFIAWVNPYRVTNFKSESKEAALATLSEKNPAKMHPEWTVFYGGKLFFDPGIPEVQKLVSDGVDEIFTGYDVDGVIYDDYFYPYPVENEEFDDAATFEKYAEPSQSLADFRRESVNRMVKASYETVKKHGKEKTFGISPFGIWKNASSDPAGSETAGFEAYNSLYCDALAWIRGGYIDYISPQIYWQTGYKIADFSVLTRWWSAQVDGTDVDLIISQAAYRVSSFDKKAQEIVNQIQYARSFMGVTGNIQYGYADIKKNTEGLRDALRNLYSHDYEPEAAYTEPIDGIAFSFPKNGAKVNCGSTYVLAASDPNFPVYGETGKIARTKSGFLATRMNVLAGKNTLTLSQNGKEYRYTLTGREVQSGTDLGAFKMASADPGENTSLRVRENEKISVSVQAPVGSAVSVSFLGKSYPLEPAQKAETEDENSTLAVTYSGSISAEKVVKNEKLLFFCERGEESVTMRGGTVEIFSAKTPFSAVLTQNDVPLKIAPNSSFYDDFLNAQAGMTDDVSEERGDYFRLAFGGWVGKENVREEEKVAADSELLSIRSRVKDKRFELLLENAAAVPLTAQVSENDFVITLFHTAFQQTGKPGKICKNSLFSGLAATRSGKDCILTLNLIDPLNFYGFEYAYTEDGILFSFTLPQNFSAGEKPLSGKTIAIDAGHGGIDSGAPGFLSDDGILWEKYFNFQVACILRDKLEKLGAKVVMVRTDDTNITMEDRREMLNRLKPDLCVSVHHNSLPETSDANSARGVLGLYWAHSGRLLAKSVQNSLVNALMTFDCGVSRQRLGMCRNHKFPLSIFEIGFMCSPSEYERMFQKDYSDTVAEAIADGILDYYRQQGKWVTK